MINRVMLSVPTSITSRGVIEKMNTWGAIVIKHIDAASAQLQDWRYATAMLVASNVVIFFSGVQLCRMVECCFERRLPLDGLKKDEHDIERDKRSNVLTVIFIGTAVLANIAICKAFRLPLSPWKIAMISTATNLACIIMKN